MMGWASCHRAGAKVQTSNELLHGTLHAPAEQPPISLSMRRRTNGKYVKGKTGQYAGMFRQSNRKQSIPFSATPVERSCTAISPRLRGPVGDSSVESSSRSSQSNRWCIRA